MNRNKLGIVLETTGLPLRQGLNEAARLSVAGVQIDAVGELNPKQLTETGKRELKTLLRSANLELAALNCPLRRGLDNPENLQPRLDQIREVMDFAFVMGPRLVICPLPKLPTDLASPAAQTLKESIIALASYGDRCGTFIALEPGLDSGETVRDYLKTFDYGSLKVAFDPANFLLNGFDMLGSLTALAGTIAYTQARDGQKRTVSGTAKETGVGAGDIEWMSYLGVLESVGYRGYLMVDREDGASRFADVATGVQFLKRFVN